MVHLVDDKKDEEERVKNLAKNAVLRVEEEKKQDHISDLINQEESKFELGKSYEEEKVDENAQVYRVYIFAEGKANFFEQQRELHKASSAYQLIPDVSKIMISQDSLIYACGKEGEVRKCLSEAEKDQFLTSKITDERISYAMNGILAQGNQPGLGQPAGQLGQQNFQNPYQGQPGKPDEKEQVEFYMNLFEHESGQRKSVLSNLKSMIMGNEQDI